MKEIWDHKYKTPDSDCEYKHNDYFITQLIELKPFNITLPTESQGSNSIYAASLCCGNPTFDQHTDRENTIITRDYPLEITNVADDLHTIVSINVQLSAVIKSIYHKTLITIIYAS